jgi:lipopolysaccharide export system protein LptC
MAAVPRPGHIWGRLLPVDRLRWGGERLIPVIRRRMGHAILTAFSETDPHAALVFSQAGRRDADRAFRAAVRHSRHVRFLRKAVPAVVALVLLGGIGFAILINPMRLLAKLPVDLNSIVVSGSKIMMQQPRLAGFTGDNRRYDVSAQAAGQDLTKPDLVELQGIRATMELQDNVTVETTADNGLYNTKTELLTLRDNVLVTSTNGYEAVLKEAVLDMRAGKVVSEQPVLVKTSTLNVNANRLEVAERGDILRFERGVIVLLLPDPPARHEARTQ